MGNPLTDKLKKPTPARLSRALGRTKKHWDLLEAYVTNHCEGLSCEWKFYSGPHGWTFKVMKKKRAVLYMTPMEGSFTASMALKNEALEGLRASNLPQDLIMEILEAKAYPEGRPARVEVTSQKKIGIVKKLIALKLAN